MGAAPRGQQGIASAVLAVARNFGMTLGVAAAMAVFHAAGGRTGRAWVASDYAAFRIALMVAALASTVGIGVAALRGREENNLQSAPGGPSAGERR